MTKATTTIFGSPTRRRVLQGIGAGAVGLAMPHVARAQNRTIKVGFVTPLTGPLALFGATDDFAVNRIMNHFPNGLEINGENYDLEILVRDSQSDPNRSAEVAANLILNDEVQMILPASTTDTINPAADQAELFECPCLSTAAPWQATIFPRGGGDQPFNWTYHFFWGLDEALQTFVGLWDQIETNRHVGMIFPRNADGETWGNDEYGLPAQTEAAGFEVTIPGFFQPRTNDFSAQISTFRNQNCDIIGGITYVDDLRTFVNQCRQQGYTPKAITVAAALLFPSGIEAMGELGNGMSSEVWWTPAFPFQSSLTGQTSRALADAWEEETGSQWTQPLGYSHAIWEVAIDALRRSGDPMDRAAVRDALAATNLDTLIGNVNFATGPHPNVSTTPIFGGQWVTGEKWPFDLKIVDNSVNDLFEPEAQMQPLNWS